MQNSTNIEISASSCDAGDIKTLLKENQRLKNLLDEKNKLDVKKEIFLATLIHDLKTPLNGQIKSLQMLCNGHYGELSIPQKSILEMTLESVEFVAELLNKVLSAFKYDNGDIVLDKTSFDVITLMQNCINDISALAEDKNIKIIFNSSLYDSEKMLFADKSQIRRVISNILNNAVSYAYKGTEIKINITRNDNNIIVETENSSPEIPADIREHLFEKYVTGSDSYRKVGFGLGLYLARKVVEAHNGRIYLSANSTNNRFTFEIPVVES